LSQVPFILAFNYSFGAKMSASFTPYIVQIMYMNSAWITWPLKTSLLPLVYRYSTSLWNLGWKT